MKLLLDHGGYGNFGDTAMLEGVCLRLMRAFPQAQISVVDHPGLQTSIWSYPGIHRQRDYNLESLWPDLVRNVRFFWRYDSAWRRASQKMTLRLLADVAAAGSLILRFEGEAGLSNMTLDAFCENFDGLHIAGGGNLTDTFFEELFRKCCLISGFVEQGKPVVLTGQQLGPFTSGISRKGVLNTLRNVSFVGLREPTESLAFCRQGGLHPKSFEVMGDDSFGLPAATEQESVAFLSKYGLTPHKFLAVNVRMGPYVEELRAHLAMVGDIVSNIALLLQMPVVIVPIAFDTSDSDILSGKELAEATPLRDVIVIEHADLNACLVKGILGQAFGAIGVSYHFCTFALTQGVPAVCLYDGDYYCQKGRGLCGFWADKRLALPLKGLSTGTAIRHIMDLFSDDRLRERLSGMRDEVVERWQDIFDHQVRNAFLCSAGQRQHSRASVSVGNEKS